MWQGLLVGLIVLVATVYAIWTLVPAAARLRLVLRLGTWSRHPGRSAWLARFAAAIERAARARLGGCTDCGAANAPPPTSSAPRSARD